MLQMTYRNRCSVTSFTMELKYTPGMGPTISCWSAGYRGSGSGFLALNLYPAERAVSVALTETPPLLLSLFGIILVAVGFWTLLVGLMGCRGSFLAIELQLVCFTGALLWRGVSWVKRLEIPNEIWLMGLKKMNYWNYCFKFLHGFTDLSIVL